MCVTLRDGKIYPCSFIPYTGYFNYYFAENYRETDEDSINIHKTKNMEDILNFMCKAVPFCRYCNVQKIVYTNKWEISKREMSEWV